MSTPSVRTDGWDGDASAKIPAPRATAGGYAALKGVGRAMQILEALAERPMRAQDLARRMGLKWTTAYRSLTYLEEHGYLSLNPATGSYSVGSHLYRLGIAYLNSHPLAQAAPPHLKPAADELKCAAQLNERQGLKVITLAFVDAPGATISKTQPGFSWPLNVTSKGHLLLAFAPEAVREQALAGSLTAFTEHSLTDPKALRKRIDQVRSADYAVTRDDLQLGVGSVATPIRDAEGRVVACVTLIVRSARMKDPHFVDRLLAAGSEAAISLSLMIGWRPDSVPAS
jgi:DNA-binding IclR family transcriptional regulator